MLIPVWVEIAQGTPYASIIIYLSMFGDHNSELTAEVPAATIKAHGARMFPVPAEKGAS